MGIAELGCKLSLNWPIVVHKYKFPPFLGRRVLSKDVVASQWLQFPVEVDAGPALGPAVYQQPIQPSGLYRSVQSSTR